MSNYTPLPEFEGLTEIDKEHCQVYKKLDPNGKLVRQMERQEDGSYKDATVRAKMEERKREIEKELEKQRELEERLRQEEQEKQIEE